jgi:hypothetical protein
MAGQKILHGRQDDFRLFFRHEVTAVRHSESVDIGGAFLPAG